MDTSPTLYHHSLKLDPIALDISDQENTGIIFKIFFLFTFFAQLVGDTLHLHSPTADVLGNTIMQSSLA